MSEKSLDNIGFKDVLGVFLFYLSSQAVIWPAIVAAGFWAVNGTLSGFKSFIATPPYLYLLSIGTILFGGLGVFFFCFKIEPQKTSIAFGNKSCSTTKALIAAVIGLLMAFIMTAVITNFVHEIVFYFFEGASKAQVAVEQLQAMVKSPWLFAIAALLITFFVPVVEEIIFRGFLQGWLRQLTSLKIAVGLTSLIFSAFHFSFGQGLGNIEMLAALFALSCLIGSLKERYESLKPSIFLHMLFNGVNCLAVYTNSFN